jgi:hypothetical protein
VIQPNDGVEKEMIFTPLEPYETPNVEEELCERFNKTILKNY